MRTLTNGQVARIFEEAAESYDSRSNAYTMHRRSDALARWVTGRALEVGGGTAAVIDALGNRSEIFHSDIAFPMCKVASRKVHRPSACFDAEQIPIADSSVDTVVSSEMIYYLRRPDRFVAEAFRVLHPAGVLVLSTTNPAMTLLERGRTLLRRIGFPGMFFDDGSPKFPSLTHLSGLLTAAGFRIESTSGIVPLPFRFCHPLNLILEATPLQRMGLFLIVVARKPS